MAAIVGILRRPHIRGTIGGETLTIMCHSGQRHQLVSYQISVMLTQLCSEQKAVIIPYTRGKRLSAIFHARAQLLVFYLVKMVHILFIN